MLSRRNFLQSTVSLLVLAKMDSAAASIHGSPSLSGNAPVIVNYNGDTTGAFLNIAKFIQPFSSQSGFPSLMSGSGVGYAEYPNGTFTSTATAGGVKLDPTYYGHYLMSWGGTGTISTQASNPVVIYNGGATVTGLSGANTGEVSGNFQISGANANVEFAFGVLISAVSTSLAGDHGGAGLVKFTVTTGHAGNFVDGMTFKFSNITGLPTGPNSDGSWSIFAIDNAHFSVQGSSAYAGSVGITGTGGPGVQSDGIYSWSSVHGDLSGTYSSFANLIWCRKNDLADIQAGKLVTPEIVAAFAGTKASFIRFMDMCQIQNVLLPAYAHRVLPGDFSWTTNIHKFAYWGGVLTNTSDAFTCSNPSASPASGAYVDGEIVIAQVPTGGHNTTQTPTLQITGRTGAVAAPIFNYWGSLLNMTLSGTVPIAGTNISFTFNGAGVSNHSPTPYTVVSGDGPGGTNFGTLANNIAAHLNADTTLTAAGWQCVNQNFPGSTSGLSWNIANKAFYYNPNVNSSGTFQQGAGATISATDPSGVLTLTFGFVPNGGSTSYLGDGSICTFIYSAVLGGWVGAPGANDGGGRFTAQMGGGPPLEYFAELCARANAGMWLNIGFFDQATDIYNKVFKLATLTYNGQPAVKSLAVEWVNETWNPNENPWKPCQTMACALGFLSDTGYDLHGLRTRQVAQQAVQAWSDAGRSRSQLKIINAYQFVQPNGQSFATGTATYKYRFRGGLLLLSNTTYANLGGLGATAVSTDYSTSPNRPVDWCDGISPAPYWAGAQDSFNINGGAAANSPLSAYNGLFLAAYNYAYGTPTEQAAALDFLYSSGANSGDLYNGQFNGTDITARGTLIQSWSTTSGETFAGFYWGLSAMLTGLDADRPTPSSANGFAQATIGVYCYEGGWQNGPSSLNQIAGTVSGFGYTTGYTAGLPGATTNSGPPGGASGDTAALMAQNIFYLLYGNAATGLSGWRNDARAYALVTQQFNEFKAAVNHTATRDAYPAWYGFTGPNNIWSLYPGLVTQSAPFQAYNAIAAWH